MTLKCVSLVVALVAGCLAAPLAAEAQQAGQVPRIGYLSGLPRSAPLFQQNRQAFLQGMREHGYLEGQTIAIEWRFAEGRSEQLPELAAGLVLLKVALIVAEATPAARAAKEAAVREVSTRISSAGACRGRCEQACGATRVSNAPGLGSPRRRRAPHG